MKKDSFKHYKLVIFYQEMSNDRTDLQIKFDKFEELIKKPAIQIDHKHLNQSRIALAYATEGVSKEI
jgi:hypothetical protein